MIELYERESRIGEVEGGRLSLREDDEVGEGGKLLFDLVSKEVSG